MEGEREIMGGYGRRAGDHGSSWEERGRSREVMGGEREVMGDHAHSMGEREIMGDHAQTMGVCPQRRTRVQVAAHGAQSERARAMGHGSLQVTGHASLGTGHWSRGAAALGAITAGFDSKKR